MLTFHWFKSRSEFSRHTGVMRWTILVTVAFLLATVVVFFVYRALFLLWFSPTTLFSEAWRIYLSGIRLDAALVAMELIVLTVVFLFLRNFRPRGFTIILALLTFLHGGVAIANFFFFKERDQHLWEMLLVNITRPSEILTAVLPFFELHPVAMAMGVVTAVTLLYLLIRMAVQAPAGSVDLWRPGYRIRHGVLLIVLLCIVNLDPAAYQKTKYWNLGWIPLPAASQLYMRFDGYQANQAVINPLHDFFRFYLPATLAGPTSEKVERLDRQEALAVSLNLLNAEGGDSRYPLLRALPQGPELGLKNVILIQVEGLTGSLMGKKREGREVMPFINGLSRKGLYFNNVVQSFNATDGSVLSTVTSMHKTFFNKNWQYFLPAEVNGYFGSLPHLLGQDGYRHFAMHGFHNRREDFTGFMRNQGYETVDYPDLESRLGGEEAVAAGTNTLGVFDGVFLQEAAEILAEADGHFTAHLITATTHSPWVIPDDAKHPFKDKRDNAFHYLDQSIKGFLKSLQEKSNGFDETLFVILADHTSVLLGGGAMERLQVPLIFYSPRLEAVRGNWPPKLGQYFSHVDVLPTILQLLDGQHHYSGMGMSLLSGKLSKAGAISSNRYYSLYLQDGYALRYSPYVSSHEEFQLFAILDDEIIEEDISGSHADILARLKREYFSLYETSDRLAREKRLIPLNSARSAKNETPR